MRLVIHNYGIIDDLAIEMSPGLTTISGHNGTGKSTTVDALYFALTGEPMDGRNVAELVNWNAVDGKAVVVLSCEAFTVTRIIKNGLTHKLELPGNQVLTKKADVNAWLFEHYQIDNPGVLREVFFSAQLHATDLFDTTNSNRLNMLSKMFGLDRLEHCRTVIYRILSDTPIPTVNEELIQQLADRVKASEDAVATASADVKNAESAVAAINFDAQEYERVRNAPTDVEKSKRLEALQTARKNVDTATVSYSELSGKLANFQKFREMKTQYDLRAQRKKLLEELAAISEGISRDKLLEAQRKVGLEDAVLGHHIEDLRKRIIDTDTCPLTGGKPCLDYLRFHDPQLIEAEIAEKQKRRDDLQEDLKQIAELIGQDDEKSKQRARINYQLEQIELGPDPEFTEEEVDKELADLGDFEQVRAAHASLDEYLNIWEGEVSKHEQWWNENSLIDTVTDAQKQEWADKYREHYGATIQLKAAQEALASKQYALKQDKDMLQEMLTDRERVMSQQKRVEDLKDVRDLLSRENLQRALMQRAMKRVNKEIASCSRIFNFKYRVFLTETGDIVFQDDVIEPKDVRFLSGGQKYTAAIITRIAFARVLNTAFDFLVLDEPSICLDDSSREMLAALLSALNERFKSENKYLVVPTHDELLLAQGENFKVKEED